MQEVLVCVVQFRRSQISFIGCYFDCSAAALSQVLLQCQPYLAILGGTARMAVGHPSFVSSPKAGNSERGSVQAQSIVSPKVGKKERVDWVYPLLPGGWDKNRITWSLAKVRRTIKIKFSSLSKKNQAAIIHYPTSIIPHPCKGKKQK